MKLYVYVAFNRFLECSGQPKFDDHTPEVFAASFKRMLLTSDDEKAFTFENTAWYLLGEYDDETMIFKAKDGAVKLFDCNDILEVRKIKAKLLDAAKKREEEGVKTDGVEGK